MPRNGKSEYMVRFTGYIDSEKRPAGFPSMVFSDIFFEAGNLTELKDSIKAMYKIFASQQCMLVPKNPDTIQNDETRFDYDSLIYVPMHMITYIGTTTKMLAGEVPTIDEDGQPRYADGSKTWKN